MQRCVVKQKFTDVLEKQTASIFTAEEKAKQVTGKKQE
jgi:hypothetical protein